MNFPAVADLQRWSAEVARDPASPAFVPLARAFRRQGRREAALRLCLRGLEHNPAHIEAHLLLALLYLDSGDRQRACDEWGMVLHLEPESFEAHRGMGFYYLERGELPRAREHLERAGTARPGEPAVREALNYVRERTAGPDGPTRRPGAVVHRRDGATARPRGRHQPRSPRRRARPSRSLAVPRPRRRR